jgi:hypothetical protein
MVATALMLAFIISCATTGTSGRPENLCPEVKRENCAGQWRCDYDRRGCQACVCAPFYYESPPVQDVLTPIDIQ